MQECECFLRELHWGFPSAGTNPYHGTDQAVMLLNGFSMNNEALQLLRRENDAELCTVV